MLPAAIFVAVGVFFYQDFIFSIAGTKNDKFSTGLVVFIGSALIMWIGFALFSIVNWTVRLYEGYYIHPVFQKLLVLLFYKRAHRRKVKNIQKVLQAKKDTSSVGQETVRKYYNQAWADFSDVELTMPLHEEDLLPSKLGNVLRASEQYPEKYGITAGINLWTRLAVLLPPEMSNQLEEKNNNILFLLNSSLLAYFHFFIAITISVLHVNEKTGNAFSKHLVLAILFFIVGYFLYILTIPVAKTMGLLIRSSFDLYRFDLLKQLNYPIPTSLSQEQRLWVKISDFIVTAGKLGRQPLDFEYGLQSKYLPDTKPLRSPLKKRKN
ncbi:hypothetical protein FBQ81_13780 [Chloroflexi bacterium CFX6]|nr:hypothetical protein [Chloroflexi bacterium CFX6]